MTPSTSNTPASVPPVTTSLIKKENTPPISGLEKADIGSVAGSQLVLKKHTRFYFDDGNVTFLVRDILYRVHKYFFGRDSLYFLNVLLGYRHSNGENSSLPIFLTDVEPSDFDNVLSILYPTNFHECEVKTVEAWTSILRLSSRWMFKSMRMLAIDRLQPITSAVDKVVLGRIYGIPAWIDSGFVALCERALPLTRDEGRRLSLDDVVLVAIVRESMRVQRPDVTKSKIEKALQIARANVYNPYNPAVTKIDEKVGDKDTNETSGGRKEEESADGKGGENNIAMKLAAEGAARLKTLNAMKRKASQEASVLTLP